MNICQVSNSTCSEKTIKETAQRIIRDKLSERDIRTISRILVKTASSPITSLSCLSRLWRELGGLNALKEIIFTILDRETTCTSNKIQIECSEQRKNEELHYSDHFSLESVKKKLDEYNISNISDKQPLADVMIMLCIRPAKIKNLHIFNGGVTGYAKNREVQNISWVFRSLKKNEERARELLT